MTTSEGIELRLGQQWRDLTTGRTVVVIEVHTNYVFYRSRGIGRSNAVHVERLRKPFWELVASTKEGHART